MLDSLHDSHLCKNLPVHCSYWGPQCWTGAGAPDAPRTGSRTSGGGSTPVCPPSSTRRGTYGTAGRFAAWGSGRGWCSVWTAGNKAAAQEPPVSSPCSSDGVCACLRPRHRTATRPQGQHGSGRRSHSEPDWRGMQLGEEGGEQEQVWDQWNKRLGIGFVILLTSCHTFDMFSFPRDVCRMPENLFLGLAALTLEKSHFCKC